VSYYCEKLSLHGVQYPVVDAIKDFRVAALDFARVVLAYLFTNITIHSNTYLIFVRYFFKSYTPQSLAVAIKDAGELTHTCSLPHIIDLLLYFDMLLSQLETHNKFII